VDAGATPEPKQKRSTFQGTHALTHPIFSWRSDPGHYSDCVVRALSAFEPHESRLAHQHDCLSVKTKAMPKRIRNPFWSRSVQRRLTAMTRTAKRDGSKAMTQALRPLRPASAKKTAVKTAALFSAQWSNGFAAGAAGTLPYRLFKPPGVRRGERLPLLVMLHGCGQDAQALAASFRMNQIAARERFVVLYPEQDRLSSMQGCWNWHQTRSGKA
jgi:hypothetical protein